MGTIKSFKGKLASAGQDQIPLAGGDDDIGYKIVKMELMSETPGIGSNAEHIVKVYKTQQSSVDGVINFDDDALLAAGWLPMKTSNFLTSSNITLFDNEIVNQDIYVTGIDVDGGEPINYLIHLEEVKMKDSEAAVVNYKAALLHG
jgi:hypothetical protein